jgi:glycosyltransferase involved in cell wall biosynthesis
VQKIAMLGSYIPRLCGIATFTDDLSEAIAAQSPDIELFVVAMNDAGRTYEYTDRVRFEIAEGDVTSYRRAADFLNVNTVDVVCVQHEYGIFGGKAGGHLLTLLRELRMPIITTFHTLLTEPNALQRAVIEEVIKLSKRCVVMTERGSAILQEVHGTAKDKIDLIPHGIPQVPFDCDNKDKLGIAGKKVLLTFGLLSPDKGIEYVIDALPAIVAKHPDAVYVVLGATHPHVKKSHGEMYRLSLENRALRLGVDKKIIFHNRFVSQKELIEFLSATDIYITPYLKLEQTTSGTLAYAVGSGRAVISTPYWHASELLADDRGVLVPWRDPQAIADAAIDLLSDDTKRLTMRKRAAALGRDMLWPAVGRSYLQSFTKAQKEYAEHSPAVFQAKTLAERPADLPELNLEHLWLMTDDTGMLQHAAFSIPRYGDGYCLDDNARALLLMTLVEDAGMAFTKETRVLASRYLAFVNHAFNPESGRFHNFLSYARQWHGECGSEECHGRALWALGSVIGRANDPGQLSLSGNLFHAALPAVNGFSSPRAWAYTLLGIEEYLRAFEGDHGVQSVRKTFAERLLGLFLRTQSPDWPWFEDYATYSNARLSQALIVSGNWMANMEMLDCGLKSLDWLVSVQRSEDGFFAPIGSNGFYPRGGTKSLFDQQPVEACGMVSACLEAHRITGDKLWSERARWAFNWLVGENHLQQSLYDVGTGGCRDGLHMDWVNQNQGAESTLSFLMALTEMYSADTISGARFVRRGGNL